MQLHYAIADDDEGLFATENAAAQRYILGRICERAEAVYRDAVYIAAHPWDGLTVTAHVEVPPDTVATLMELACPAHQVDPTLEYEEGGDGPLIKCRMA